MIAMHRPAKVDYTSVRTFMWNHTPIMQPEASWIDPEEDMITLRAGREHAWLDSCIERLLKCFHCSLLEVCCFNDQKANAVVTFMAAAFR